MVTYGDAAGGRAAKPAVVLTCLHVDDQSLLVIPAATALAETVTQATLKGATTFGDARSDVGAAELLRQQLEHDPQARDAADDDPFDVEDVFGEDWRLWRADARASTAHFLRSAVPDLGDRYLRPDTGWGFDYDPVPFVAPEDRTALEADLRERGYDVRPWPALAELSLGGGVDLAEVLRGAL